MSDIEKKTSGGMTIIDAITAEEVMVNDIAIQEAQGAGSNKKSNPKRKNICRNFLNGNCRFGNKCKFKHEGASVSNDKSKRQDLGKSPKAKVLTMNHLQTRVDMAMKVVLAKGNNVRNIPTSEIVHGNPESSWDTDFSFFIGEDLKTAKFGKNVRPPRGQRNIHWHIITSSNGVKCFVLIHYWGTSVFIGVSTPENVDSVLEFNKEGEIKPFNSTEGWKEHQKAATEKAATEQAAVVQEAVDQALAKKAETDEVSRRGMRTGAEVFVPNGEVQVLQDQIALMQKEKGGFDDDPLMEQKQHQQEQVQVQEQEQVQDLQNMQPHRQVDPYLPTMVPVQFETYSPTMGPPGQMPSQIWFNPNTSMPIYSMHQGQIPNYSIPHRNFYPDPSMHPHK